MPPPMLVKKLGESREATLARADFARGVTLQPKLNGVRNVSFRAEGPEGRGRLVMYSRSRREYPGLGHIRAELLPMLDPRLLPRVTGVERHAAAAAEAYAAGPVYLDGELFRGGRPLQWISGQARKEADDEDLEYHVFDCFFPAAKAAGFDMESRHRQAFLDAAFAAAAAAGLAHPHVVRVPNRRVTSEAEMLEASRAFVRQGFEGGIARKDWAGYRYSANGYHSPNLVKIKPLHSDEFRVVGFTQGSKGKDVGAVIWVCEVAEKNRADPKDFEFSVVPKDMSYEQRRALFACLSAPVADPARAGATITRFRRDLYGLPMTVEYPELSSKTGKPVQAKACGFRTYEDRPEDPVKKLFQACGVAD